MNVYIISQFCPIYCIYKLLIKYLTVKILFSPSHRVNVLPVAARPGMRICRERRRKGSPRITQIRVKSVCGDLPVLLDARTADTDSDQFIHLELLRILGMNISKRCVTDCSLLDMKTCSPVTRQGKLFL